MTNFELKQRRTVNEKMKIERKEMKAKEKKG